MNWAEAGFLAMRTVRLGSEAAKAGILAIDHLSVVGIHFDPYLAPSSLLTLSIIVCLDSLFAPTSAT